MSQNSSDNEDPPIANVGGIDLQNMLQSVLDTNKQMLERLAIVEKKVNEQPNAPNAANVQPATKVKKEDSNDDGYDSEDSNLSMITNQDDVKVIKSILKPKYNNQDHMTKEQQSQLARIQQQYRSKIETLKYSTLESKENKGEIVVHNYGVWIKSLLKYFTVLSPTLVKSVKTYLSSIDIDEFMESGSVSAEIPQMSDEEYPLITRLAAVSAITDSLSADFQHLAEDSI